MMMENRCLCHDVAFSKPYDAMIVQDSGLCPGFLMGVLGCFFADGLFCHE